MKSSRGLQAKALGVGVAWCLVLSVALGGVPSVWAAPQRVLTPPAKATIEVAKAAVAPIAVPTVEMSTANQGRTVRLVLEQGGAGRLLQVTEAFKGRQEVLRYVYEASGSVLLYYSFTRKDEAPRFTHYYRYLVDGSGALALLLEEGEIFREGRLARVMYDYLPGGVVHIRTYDKAGRLLRFESSEGEVRVFHYGEGGELLTIQRVDAEGVVTFYDQVRASQKDLSGKLPREFERSLAVAVSAREKMKKQAFQGVRISDESMTFERQNASLGASLGHSRFMEWLERAHSFRAGPIRGALS